VFYKLSDFPVVGLGQKRFHCVHLITIVIINEDNTLSRTWYKMCIIQCVWKVVVHLSYGK